MRKKVHDINKGIQILCLLAFLFSYFQKRELPDFEERSHKTSDLLSMKAAYEEARPPDTLTTLDEYTIKAINALVDLIDEQHYVAFPSYQAGQSFQEFDTKVTESFSRQLKLYQEESSKYEAITKRHSFFEIIVICLCLLTLFLEKFVIKWSKEESDSEVQEPVR